MTVQVLNGANLGRLGRREPEKYGTTTYAELVELVATAAMENYRARFNRAFGVESRGFYARRRPQA